ncbi:hypothetical protein CANARDRAFT_187588, partial [[Candida] arabinofermentans NRRL YB-2248]
LQTFQHMFEYIWDRDISNDDHENDLVVLGNTYSSKEDPTEPLPITSSVSESHGTDDTENTDDKNTNQWPDEFIKDVETRIWLTYRCGFPLIKKADQGPSPLSFGSLIRGTIDLSTINKGFTTDAGWGCMIRTSQSLLANALLNLQVGRDWRYTERSDLSVRDRKHCDIVSFFVDIPSAPFSIHNFVEQGVVCSNKKPGEWFGPSAAARSIQELCENNFDKCKLKVYLTSSGDIYEDELLHLAKENEDSEIAGADVDHFNPVLILAGIRLGVKNVNRLYWDFLKQTLSLSQSVGIAGGRPSSSHYFFGYQGDYLFYLDPHVPQNALLTASGSTHSEELLLDSSNYLDVEPKLNIQSVHTKKIRKLHLDQMDPSMLLGLVVKSKDDYLDLKKSIDEFDPNKKFLNIFSKRPTLMSSKSLSAPEEGMEDSEFVDLGVQSMNEYDCAIDDIDYDEDDDTFDEPVKKLNRAFSQPVLISKDDTFDDALTIASNSEIEFDKTASMVENPNLLESSDFNETFEEIAESESMKELESDEEPVVVS